MLITDFVKAMAPQVDTIDTEQIDQEIQELIGFPIEEYEPCAIETIKRFWPQIKQSRLIDTSNLIGSTYRVHQLLTPNGLSILFDLAVKTKDFIKERTPEGPCAVFSLGQSPAWLVEMMKVIDENQRINDTRYDLIAFSGSWYEENKIDLSQVPSQEKIDSYKRYLNTLAFKRLPENKTFIIEFPHHMNGLFSFMDVIRRCEFQNYNLYKVNILISKGLTPYPGKILNFITQEIITNFIIPMANSDRFDDRLVMSYHSYSWLTKNPFDFQPSESAKLLQSMLRAYVDLKIQ